MFQPKFGIKRKELDKSSSAMIELDRVNALERDARCNRSTCDAVVSSIIRVPGEGEDSCIVCLGALSRHSSNSELLLYY